MGVQLRANRAEACRAGAGPDKAPQRPPRRPFGCGNFLYGFQGHAFGAPGSGVGLDDLLIRESAVGRFTCIACGPTGAMRI